MRCLICWRQKTSVSSFWQPWLSLDSQMFPHRFGVQRDLQAFLTDCVSRSLKANNFERERRLEETTRCWICWHQKRSGKFLTALVVILQPNVSPSICSCWSTTRCAWISNGLCFQTAESKQFWMRTVVFRRNNALLDLFTSEDQWGKFLIASVVSLQPNVSTSIWGTMWCTCISNRLCFQIVESTQFWMRTLFRRNDALLDLLTLEDKCG